MKIEKISYKDAVEAYENSLTPEQLFLDKLAAKCLGTKVFFIEPVKKIPVKEFKLDILEIGNFNFMYNEGDVFLFNNTVRVYYKGKGLFAMISEEELPKEGTFTFEHILEDIQSPEPIIFHYKLIE
jgi:hypothetical protein